MQISINVCVCVCVKKHSVERFPRLHEQQINGLGLPPLHAHIYATIYYTETETTSGDRKIKKKKK